MLKTERFQCKYYVIRGDCSRHGYGTSSMRNLLRDVLTDYKIELDSRIYGNMSPRSYYYRQYDGNTKWCFDSCLMYGLRQANIKWYMMIMNLCGTWVGYNDAVRAHTFSFKSLSDFTYIAIYDVFSGVRSSNAIKSIVLLSKHHFTLYTIGQAWFILV